MHESCFGPVRRILHLSSNQSSSHKQTQAHATSPLHGDPTMGRLPLSYLDHEPPDGRRASRLYACYASAPIREAARHYTGPRSAPYSLYFFGGHGSRQPAHRGRRPALWLDLGHHGPKRPPRRRANTTMDGISITQGVGVIRREGMPARNRIGHVGSHLRHLPMASAAKDPHDHPGRM